MSGQRLTLRQGINKLLIESKDAHLGHYVGHHVIHTSRSRVNIQSGALPS
jgi:hypothetical protein